MNVKLNPARMAESVQISLPTTPVNVQANLWEETANRVSIACFYIYFLNKINNFFYRNNCIVLWKYFSSLQIHNAQNSHLILFQNGGN